ncbi:LPS-assembly protein LptD [Sideroxydans lithotrophicus]|uniref:LPS-assembly protein LptD n=1 Tax=Sideroxydans lithotrophicus (strain ES-1) TaxID=580332 RepID=D5CTI1_SIDLE|nr:LPS-assembly protein LptD [Sideroxydans lithotrophicus]ADE10287.1 Organic solvent tolerance protein [Sideroxydans lithotrophicus ES-1]
MPFRFPSVLILLLGTFPLFSHAEDAGLPLKLDPAIKRHTGASEGTAAFINAQHVEAKKGEQLEASGNVELRQNGQVINAAHLVYGQESKDVLAEGAVRIEQTGFVVTGPVLKLNLDTDVGEMVQPQFTFSENHSRGAAETLHIEGKKNYTFDDATYTTCPAGNDDWLLRVSRLDLDRATQVGVAHNARIDFKGVPILYTPWMDFPLNDDRRSGFLGPTFGSTNTGGSEFTLPYYWNISPNFDATISPRVISKRGTQFNNEFRYLEPSYTGVARYEILSGDRVSNTSRSYLALQHAQNLGAGFGLALNLNRVSDDAYFRDLATTVSGTSQLNLLRDGTLSYGAGSWTALAKVQRFQTLQDPLSPVVVPYRRQPQVLLTGQQTMADANVNFTSEYVDFRHDTLVNGQRLVLNPSVSYPLLNDLGYYLTPKLGMHYTQYRMGANNTTAIPDATRTLPIFSVDSGMAFERDLTSFLGGDYVQTLEPRLYYVYIPYKDQSMLPVFDSAQAPFNFGQIFSENRFFGSDRIGDANMATLALTSRMIDNEGGTERLRVMLGERFSFKAPQVNLVTPADNTNRSDILLGLGGKLSNAWNLDSLVQYNPNQTHTEAYNVTARYKPEAGKLLNLGYRFTRNTLHQADVSSQWPLFGRWQGVARLSYSLQDKRAVESLAGVEYNQACWTMRFVAQSITTATNVRSTGMFLQLELNDLVRIGSDPLDALRLSVPGYTKMNSLPAEQPAQGQR